MSSLATFNRVSGLRTKELRNILPEMITFPRHHEVRFAQHLLQLVLVAIKNNGGCRQHWQKLTDAPRGMYDKKEKAKCTGFFRMWKPFGMQEWLTTFMADICSIFQYLEKSNQKPNTIIPDILCYKKVALQKLNLLEEKPYPGKMLLNLMIKELHFKFNFTTKIKLLLCQDIFHYLSFSVFRVSVKPGSV